MSTRQLQRPATSTHVIEQDAGSRIPLFDLSVGLVEDVRSARQPPRRTPEGFSPDFQVALPYRGIFVWHVGGDEVVVDANQVLFVTGGERYAVSSPLPHSYGELIITPDLTALEEIARAAGASLPSHPLFRLRSRRANPRLQSFRARFLTWANGGPASHDLEVEELVLALLRSALDDGEVRHEPSGSTKALIRQTKEFLQADLARPIRLGDVARAVGASPAYLTHLFRRVEGTSLHRYLTQLRLARALVELPHANDLTALALEIGFSSHSHFTAAFRRAFGVTPSEFREGSRRRVRPAPPSSVR